MRWYYTDVLNLGVVCLWRKAAAINILELYKEQEPLLGNIVGERVVYVMFKTRAAVFYRQFLPRVKESSLRLRYRNSQLPQINMERYKTSFVNRLFSTSFLVHYHHHHYYHYHYH